MSRSPTDLGPDTVAFLTERHLATLTTLRPDGSPHVVPVGVTFDAGHRHGAGDHLGHVGQGAARPGRAGAGGLPGRRPSLATLEGTAVVRGDAGAVADAEGGTPSGTAGRGRTRPGWCWRSRSTAFWATGEDAAVSLELSDVDLTTEVVRSARLLLRPWRADDEDAVFRACQDPEIQRWIALIPVPYTREDARSYVHRDGTGGTERRAADCSVAIEVAGRVVGSAGIGFAPGRFGPGDRVLDSARCPRLRLRGGGGARAGRLGAPPRGATRPPRRRRRQRPVAGGRAQGGVRQEGVVRGCLGQRDGSRADAVLFGRIPGD